MRLPKSVSASWIALCLCACSAPPPRPVDRLPFDAIPAWPRHGGVDASAREPVPHPIARDVAVAPAPRTVRGLRFEDEPLDEALRRLQVVGGVPVIVTPAAREAISSGDLRVTFDLDVPLSVRRALELMVGGSGALRVAERDGLLHVGTRDELRSASRLHVYDVRDLLAAHPGFVAPTIRSIPSGDAEYARRSGGELDEPTRALDPDALIAIIKDATGPELWEPEGDATIDVTETGYLLVRAPDDVHARIGRSPAVR
ncbi:MAG: hypothetical protein IPM29_02520 [Planctomycetes bacterium]|nr:hypothetical protein [Planctomycetota bacterium]